MLKTTSVLQSTCCGYRVSPGSSSGERGLPRTLSEGLDLAGLDARAPDPDEAFQRDGAGHGADGSAAELLGFVLGAGEELFDGFLEDLEECYDHDLGGC